MKDDLEAREVTSSAHGVQDTVAAICTPPGPGGIGMVRITGPDAMAVGLKIFTPRGRAPRTDPEPKRALVGHVHQPGFPGEPIETVSILDVHPTISRLLGLDVSTNVDGRALLDGGLTEVELVSSDGGVAVITGVAEAERVDVLTGGIVDDAAPVEIAIDTGTGLISSVDFDVETGDGVAFWRVELDNYGAQVDVTAPPLG